MNRILMLPLLATVLSSVPAHAEQRKDVRDGSAIDAVVSSRSPTRVRIEGAKIVDVVGNIYSSTNCNPKGTDTGAGVSSGVNQGGEFVLSCDLAKGEIYVRPVAGIERPFSMFVSSGRATYTLQLRRADIGADTIVLVDRTPAGQAGFGAPGDAGSGRTSGYVRSLKAMLAAMASSDGTARSVRMQQLSRPTPLWKEASFTLTQRFEGRGLVGEKYELKNISGAPMVLAEQEFDREDEPILAVAVEHMNLRPGESTFVYIIKAGDEP